MNKIKKEIGIKKNLLVLSTEPDNQQNLTIFCQIVQFFMFL